jgi:transcriptional regulator with XRE-family HTH domain
MKEYQKLKEKYLQDEEVKKVYDESGPEFELVRLIIEKRNEQGLTQEELARRIGTRQSAVSRLEKGDYNPTLSFLRKVARALDTELHISLDIPVKKKA